MIPQCAAALWKACWSRGDEREKAKEEAIESLNFLDNQIKDKKFFGGDSVGLVDFAANFTAHWFLILQELAGIQILTQSNFPNFWKWVDEYCNNTLVKENLPDKDELTASFKMAFATGTLYN